MTLSTSDFATLASQVSGPLFRPGDDGYQAERAGFQTALQHRATVIVGAVSIGDVRAAVRFAGRAGLPIAVQATGHGMPAVAEGGVLISTRRMTAVTVDPAARTAKVEAGTRWESVITAAAPHGLAPLSGSAPHVGVVSYTLGGGLGLLSRRYGYAADHVRSIDVVTADGQLRHVTANREPDLFWALRGGRDNFGVVTGLEIDLMPVATLYGGSLAFDADQFDVVTAYQQWTTTLPEELTSSLTLLPFPDAPVFPGPLRGRYVATVRIAYTGDAESGEKLVAPLRAIGPRLLDSLAEMPFSESGSIYNDGTEPHGYSGTGVLLREFDAAAVRTAIDLAGPAAPVLTVVELRHLGGALARRPAVANAIGHRDAQYLLRVVTLLDGVDPSIAESVQQRFFAALSPLTLGSSLNFTYGASATADRVRPGFEPADYRRLAELKASYDPANLFRLNQHIAPA